MRKEQQEVFVFSQPARLAAVRMEGTVMNIINITAIAIASTNTANARYPEVSNAAREPGTPVAQRLKSLAEMQI